MRAGAEADRGGRRNGPPNPRGRARGRAGAGARPGRWGRDAAERRNRRGGRRIVSRAFVKEDDQAGDVPLPDRPISPHRNLVTRRGLRLIEEKIAHYRGDLARASAAGDREAISRASRELRYWTARLDSAEVVEPDPDA